jgi:hypothetical protein
MEIAFPRVENYIKAPDSVEFLVVVGGRTIRAAIEWSSMQHLIGSDIIQDESVRDFIRKNRGGIELAIKARLLAQGAPIAGRFVLTLHELQMSVLSDPAVKESASG